ncbi:MAG: hypothetical protein GY870_14625 [archaeon]|nr:hypothetical protein [archaeon]
MIQDSLEDYIDVFVGNAKKNRPSVIFEDKIEYLIIGDVVSKENPSLEIQNWLLEYREISNNSNLIVKAISGFYIAPSDIEIEPSGVEILQENINAERIFPPILRLKLNRLELALENGAHDLVKEYSNDFIEIILEKKESE